MNETPAEKLRSAAQRQQEIHDHVVAKGEQLRAEKERAAQEASQAEPPREAA